MQGQHGSSFPVRRRVGAALTRGANGDVSAAEPLEQQIADGTAGVKAHLDRINIYAAAVDGPRIYGALLDLFIVTGPSAAEVRRRALSWGRDALPGDLHAALMSRVTSDVTPETPMPGSEFSLLHRAPAPLPEQAPAAVAAAAPAPASDRMARVARFKLGDSLLAPTVTAMETAHRDSVTARVSGTFGELVVTPGSIAIRLAPGANLTTVRPNDVTITTSPISAIDLNGAFTPGVGLWNLALAVSGNRLPSAVDIGAVYLLTRMPDLERVDRVSSDAGVLEKLRTQMVPLAQILQDEPASARAVVTAAWASGMLTKMADATPVVPPAPAASPAASATPVEPDGQFAPVSRALEDLSQPAAPPRGGSLRSFLANLPDQSTR